MTSTSMLRLAWRNLWRNRRRTWVSMSAIALGLALVIVYGGLIAGVLHDATEQLDATGMGHVEINAKGWRARHETSAVVHDVDALRARLSTSLHAQIAARVVVRGLLGSDHGDEVIELHGVDWRDEVRVSAAVNAKAGGAVPDDDDDHGLLLGQELAARLRVKPGEDVRVTLRRRDGALVIETFHVRGLYHASSSSIGRRRVLVARRTAAGLLGATDVAHQIVLQLDGDGDGDERGLDAAARSERLAAHVRAIVDDAARDGANSAARDAVVVQTYGEIVPLFRSMEALMDGVLVFAAGFIYLLVGLGIVNTLLMSVLERTREFGVLQALGTRPLGIVLLVLCESFWTGTLAVVVGLALGLSLTFLGSGVPLFDLHEKIGEAIDVGGLTIGSAFRTRFSLVDGVRAAVWVYAMALLVGLYPAWHVARMRPVDALRG